MAFVPCDAHGGMFPGGASTAFVRMVEGVRSYGGRQKLCPDCATHLLAYLAEYTVKISEGGLFFATPAAEKCMNCGSAAAARPFKLYVSTYPRGKAEAQWYGEACFDCAAAVAEDLHLGALDSSGGA